MPARSLDLDGELDARSVTPSDERPRADPAPGALRHPRFDLLGALGRGAFGTVFAARDLEREETVALKVLHRRAPASIQGFRREFRELVELTHPHLPLLYELFVSDDAPFFTMELVVGTSIERWVRGGPSDGVPDAGERPPGLDAATTWSASDVRAARSTMPAPQAPVDLDRLERCLTELGSALGFLHARGLVHGDVKPSNILIRRDGRLVLLDFGLVRRAGTPRERFAGTPRYAAPEVGLEPSRPPEDVYAVGTLVFELLAGRPPFPGSGREVLDDKRAHDPPGLASAAPAAPPSIVARVDRWLSRAPEARGAILEGPSARPPVFVGREEELARLASELARVRPSRGRAVLVIGPAGLGKSALLDAFAARVEERAEVLRARDTGRERVAYAAIGPLVELLDPREVTSAPSSHAALARAIAAKLTERARRRPVCVLVDDLHFAGPDAVAVLELLLQPPWLPGVLFVLASRPARPGAPALRLPLPIDAIEVSPLPRDAAAELVGALAVEESLREGLTARALGHPYFLTELAHDPGSSATTLAALLDRRIEALDPVARACLEAVCIGSGAARPRWLSALVPELRGRASEVLERLTRSRLVRRDGGGSGFVPAHDLVRDRALALLGDGARQLRERACGALDTDDPGDREALIEHLSLLGRAEEVAELAERAADDASAATAHARAAELVGIALRARLAPARRLELLARYVSLCERAQRGAHAIDALDELAESARDPQDRARLATRAAYHALCMGRVEEGHRRLRRELSSLGLSWPSSKVETLARVAIAELELVRPPAVARGPSARVALDLLADASNALAMIDNPRARVLKAEAVAIARLVADPLERAEHLLRDAFYLTSLGARSRRRLAQRLEEVARLVGPTPPRRIAALREAVLAIASFQAGAGASACAALARAEAAVAETTAPTDNSAVVLRVIRGHALRLQGALPELRAHVDRVLADAEERGNAFLRFTALFGGHITWLAAGAPEVSRHRLSTLQWPNEGGAFHVQHWLRAEAEIETSLYERDAGGGVRRLGRTIVDLLTSTLRVLESVRISSDAAVGRLLLAAREEASATRGERPLQERALFALVKRRLGSSAAPQARLRHALLEAGDASLRGDSSGAVAALERARALAAGLEHALLGALAVLRLGELGAATEQDLAGAHEVLARLEVTQPRRFADVEIPGFAGRRAHAGGAP